MVLLQGPTIGLGPKKSGLCRLAESGANRPVSDSLVAINPGLQFFEPIGAHCFTG